MPSATPSSSSPRIVLGVAGGIAAYKSVELLRRLRDARLPRLAGPHPRRHAFRRGGHVLGARQRTGAHVLYGDPTTPIPHTYLGQSADLIVVAPATAHLIARYAMGSPTTCSTATLLASRAPVLLCPAMHTEMWEQPSVQENLATLRRRGVLVLEPDVGALAGGDVGAGSHAPSPRRSSNSSSGSCAATADR